MAGFEVIVRPAIFPNIRPAPTRSLPPEDDPEKGVAIIHGASGQHIDLPYSWSMSLSKSRPTETQRRVDVARVFQKEDDGTVNRDNYIDVEVANKVWVDESGPGGGTPGATSGGGVGVLPGEKVITQYFYNSITNEISDNIEIQERDKIKRNQDYHP